MIINEIAITIWTMCMVMICMPLILALIVVRIITNDCRFNLFDELRI